MNKKLTALNIVQGNNRGTVQFTEVDKDKKPLPNAVLVAVQFSDPKEAAKFEHGRDYTISIQPTK